MKLFVFESVLGCTYDDGIVGVLADNLAHAVELAKEQFPAYCGQWVKEDLSNVQEYELTSTPEPGVKFVRYGTE